MLKVKKENVIETYAYAKNIESLIKND